MRPLKEWTNGTPENNYQDGTQLDAADFDSWSKELVAVLASAGIAPEADKFDQLLTAIRKIAWNSAVRPTTLSGYGITDLVAMLDKTQGWTRAQRGTVQALADAATIAVDLALANNYSLPLAGNRTLGTPTNAVAGQSGIIAVTQDATGSRTLAFGANWKFAGGTAPALSTTAGAVDYLAYYVETPSRVFVSLVKDVK